jgi:3-oxoacyl-ACP reductase-like protein
MGLFNTLMSKIFSHSSSVATAPAPAASTPTAVDLAATAAVAPAAIPAPAATSAPAQPVDVAAILDGLAAKNSEKLDWKHSIVDLMKLVGMDSSLSARKELAHDLHYSGDMNDSAAMNIWLHQEVMKQLAANGGKVPQSLLEK